MAVHAPTKEHHGSHTLPIIGAKEDKQGSNCKVTACASRVHLLFLKKINQPPLQKLHTQMQWNPQLKKLVFVINIWWGDNSCVCERDLIFNMALFWGWKTRTEYFPASAYADISFSTSWPVTQTTQTATLYSKNKTNKHPTQNRKPSQL